MGYSLPFLLITLSSLSTLSAAYTWSFNAPPQQCSNLTVSLTGSGGKPPYRILVLPSGPTPLKNNLEVRRILDVSFPSDSTAVTFQLKYPANSQLVAVVSTVFFIFFFFSFSFLFFFVGLLLVLSLAKSQWYLSVFWPWWYYICALWSGYRPSLVVHWSRSTSSSTLSSLRHALVIHFKHVTPSNIQFAPQSKSSRIHSIRTANQSTNR